MVSRVRIKKKRASVHGDAPKQHFGDSVYISSDWYWEQDSDYRFTLFRGEALEKYQIDPQHLLGTRRWDHGGVPLGDGGRWDVHKATLQAREPFTDFVYSYTDTRGNPRFLSVSGQPVFGARKHFKGYRGSANDVTERIQTERRTIIEHAVVRILAEATNVADAATRIIQVICGTLGWACGVRWQVAQDENSIQCADTWGIASREVAGFLATTAQLALSKKPVGLARSVWLSGESLWICDVADDPAFARMPAVVTTGLHSAFAFPIKTGAHVTGVMEFFTHGTSQPDVALLNCVGYVGIQIGQFSARVEAYERLRESEVRFRALTELSSDWYWEQDEQFRFTLFLGLRPDKAGHDTSSMIGRCRWEKPRPNVTEEDWARHKAQLERHEPFYDFEICDIDADGTERWSCISGTPIVDADGHFKGYRGVAKDITARKKTEQIHRENETRFRELTALSSDWYWEQDEHLRFRFFSDTFQDKNSLDRRSFIGKTRWEIPGLSVTAEQWVEHKAVLERREPFQGFEVCRLKPDGQWFWSEVSGVPIFGPDGCFKGYRGISKDITARKLAEMASRASEERFRSLAELSSDWYWEQDENFKFIPNSTGDAGGRFEQPNAGKARWELPYEDMTEEQWAEHRATLTAHLPFYDFELKRKGKDGDYRYISVSGRPIFDADGRFSGYRGVGKDITEKKLAEQALRNSAARLRDLAALSSDWYWEQDAEFRFTAFTGLLESNTGFDDSTLLGKRRWDSPRLNLTDEDWARHKAQLERHEPFYDFVMCQIGTDGVENWASVSGMPIFNADGRFTGYRGVGKDVTTKKKAEQLLRQSEARFRDLTEFSSDWYWEQDTNYRFTILSGKSGPFGSDGGGMLGHARWEQESDFTEAQWRAHRADLDARREFSIVVRVKTTQGWRYIRTSGKPVYDERGAFAGYRGVSSDISEQKSNEDALRDSEAKFRDLTELSSDWYWEQDHDFRLTFLAGEAWDKAGFSGSRNDIGKPRWEQPYVGVSEQQWAEHKAMLRAHKTFRDFVLKRLDSQGTLRYVSLSGRPIFGPDGTFQGYRGTGKDVTDQRQQQEALLRFRVAIDATADGIHIVDCETNRIIDVNETACRDLGYTREEFLGLRIGDFVPSLDAASAAKLYESLFAAEQLEQRAETEQRHKNGTCVSIEMHCRGVVIDDRRLVVSVVRDITERKKAEAILRESEERFRGLTKLSSDWYWEMDADLRFTDVRGGNAGKSKFRSNSHNGKHRWDLPYVDVPEQTWIDHKADLYARRPFNDLVLKRRLDDGSIGVISVSGVPMYDDSGNFTGYRGVGKDITEQQASADRIQYLATHDSLTGLSNRTMFTEILNNAIAVSRRYERTFALLFLDLDRFKNINDTFGHEIGDLLLKEMSRRLADTLRDSDVVARLGGDEFVILLQEIGGEKQVTTVARKLLSTLNKPVVLLGQECRVTASIGVSVFPTDAQDEQSLMKNADIAMYRAKEEGRNNFQFYSEKINEHSLERVALETSLRSALEHQEFSLHYQAKLDLHTGKITGVEALIRWQHPQLGMVSPAQFIPLAEETGLIVSIGKWVLKTACAQNVAWQQQGLPPLCMAVNLSPRQFSDDDLLQDIATTLQETGMDAKLLELELTEGMVMQSPERAAAILRKVKALGVRVAIDDFGVGYSSLAHIKRFPIDTIKIDRSFIRDIPYDAEDNAITETIIAMGKTLSLTVVAEGVETEAQQDFLREHACDEMQGFYLNKPIDADQFAAFLRQYGQL